MPNNGQQTDPMFAPPTDADITANNDMFKAPDPYDISTWEGIKSTAKKIPQAINAGLEFVGKHGPVGEKYLANQLHELVNDKQAPPGSGEAEPTGSPIDLAAGAIGGGIGGAAARRGMGLVGAIGRGAATEAESAAPGMLPRSPEMPPPINIQEAPAGAQIEPSTARQGQGLVSTAEERAKTLGAAETSTAPKPEMGGTPSKGLGEAMTYKPEHDVIAAAAERNPDIDELLTPSHKKMFQNPEWGNEAKELADQYPDSPTVQKWRKQNDKIKSHAVEEQSKLVDDLAGGSAAPKDNIAGAKVNNSLDRAYQDHLDESERLFEPISKVALPEGIPEDMGNKLLSDIPKLRKIIGKDENGKFFVRPMSQYDPTAGATEQEWGDLEKNLVSVLNKKNVTFEDLQEARGVLFRKRVDKGERPGKVIEEAYNKWGSYMDDLADAYGPSDADYKTARTIHRTKESAWSELGKKGLGPKAKSSLADEKVLDRVFSDSKLAGMVKDAVGEDEFKKMGAEYVASLRRAASKGAAGRQSGTIFAKSLKAEEPALSVALDKDSLTRLEDLSTVESYIGDMGSSNAPRSGTVLAKAGRRNIGNKVDTATRMFTNFPTEAGLAVKNKVFGYLGKRADEAYIKKILERGEFESQPAGLIPVKGE